MLWPGFWVSACELAKTWELRMAKVIEYALIASLIAVAVIGISASFTPAP